MAGGSTEWRGRSVISKVVSLLDAFTPAAPELSLGELARTTGLPVSTTYRLASELVAWGGLERAGGGSGYRIGTRLWELGSLAPPDADLRATAAPYLQDLHQATRENVHLAVLEGRQARYVATIAGRGSVPTRARRGARLPLHATGAGKVLLAFGPESLLREVLATGLRRYTPHTVVAPELLADALDEVRRTGIASTSEEMTPGAQSVACPILDPRGTCVGALAVVTQVGAADVRALGPAVRTAALAAGRALGRPPVAVTARRTAR